MMLLMFLIFLQKNKYSGIYNLGSGKATTFIKLIEFVFKSLNIKPKIKFIEMPLNLRDSINIQQKPI